MKTRRAFIAFTLILCTTFTARTDEGLWLLDAVHKLPLEQFKPNGYELTSDQIYSTNGTSIMNAIVLLPGGTGTYVSNSGLILTNHHIAFAGIQSASSVEEDYLRDGFWAKSHAEEIPTSYTAEIVVSMKDVTAEVVVGMSDTLTADERSKAITARSREIEKKAKEGSENLFRVSSLYNGVKYYLFEYEQLQDVRLVYAPPGSIGVYGGEVDNWTWPRHTGDFAFMRAYVGPDGKSAKYSKDNIPHTPRKFLPFSSKGAQEGAFSMILGFPGVTYRYREASSLQVSYEETMPFSIQLYRTRINVMVEAGKADRAVEIKYATKFRRLANTEKKFVGVIEGMRRADLIRAKQAEEQEFAAHIAADAACSAKYGTIFADLQAATDELRTFNKKNLLLSNINTGVDLLRIANRVLTFADGIKDNVPPTDKERAAVVEFAASNLKDVDVNVDKEILVRLILMAADLPPGQRVELLDEIMGRSTAADREKRVRSFVNDLYEDTELTTVPGCEKLLSRDPKRFRKDEFVRFAEKFGKEFAPIQSRSNAFLARINALRMLYTEARLQWAGDRLVYPDANRTLRLTYGTVQSLAPRDAVFLNYLTSLRGVMEKETGEEPFIVPPKLRSLWEARDFGRYAEPKINDVPVAFLTNHDITGGNSGSSVINGRGEVIGTAFDGNWEGVVGDYVFQNHLNRSISVDSRYILFLLDKFSGARNVLEELAIR